MGYFLYKFNSYKIIKKLVFILILFALFFGFSKTAYALTEATFLPSSYNLGSGHSFNYKLRELDPISFRKATTAEYNSALPNLTSDNIVSTADSDYPIYLWLDANDTALYYSEADKIYANADSERMFYDVKHLVNADVSGFDTSRVTNMEQMFFNSNALISLDLSSWDTSNVTNMGAMFEQCNGLVSIDFTGWDVRNVTMFSRMFCDCSVTSLDLSSFVTSSATLMSQMFANAHNLTLLNISNFDTSNVTNMWAMFEGTQIEELDVTSFDVSKVTDMSRMFNGCNKLRTLDLSSFEPKSAVYMSQMFNYCLKLTTIYVDPVKWGTPRPRYSNQMFGSDYRIMGQNGTTYVGSDDGTFNLSRARVDDPENDKPGYLTDVALKGQLYHSITYPDGRVFIVEHNAGLDLEPNETTNGTYQSGEITFIYHNGVTEPTTTSQTVTMVGDGYTADGIHYYDNGISWNNSFWVRATKDITLEYAYKPEVLPGQDFPIATKEGKIFTGWYTEEDGGTKVTSYSGTEPLTLHAHYDNRTSFLKEGSNISSIIGDITNYSDSLNTFRKATESEYNNIKDSLTENNIASTEDSHFPTYMWYDGENVLYYSDADYIYINDNANNMFSSKLFVSIDLSGLYTNNVYDMASMFGYNERLQEVYFGDNFDTSNVTDMSYMFYNCSSLNNIDFYNIDMSSVTTTSEMFYNCSSLTSIDFKRKPLRSLQNAYEMFYGCSSLTYLDLTMFDNSNLYDYGYMFNNMPNLETIYVSDLWNEDNYSEQSNVFTNSTKLVGGAGTTYDENHDNSEYARIDDPNNDKPGYFTYREFRPIIYHPNNNWSVDYGSSYTFENNYQRDNTHLATVTLNKNYDGSESEYTYVDKQFVLTKWQVEKNEYDFGDTIIVDQDIYLEPIEVETIIGADLSPARRSGYKFLGWYTDPEGGELVESYDTEEDITLYAHWRDAQYAYLIEGSTINGKFDKTNTTEFRRSTLEEYNAANLTSDNIISTEDSPNVVYMWNTTIDSKVVTLYYTEADFMYMNADSSHMFQGLSNITELDLSDFITSNVTNMEYMFGYIGVTSLDLSTFDTSNVTKMNEMFFNSANLQELNVSSFDVSNVTTMVGMFDNCPSLQELDLSSFDTRNVRLMGSMFAHCSKLTTIYVSNKWSTSGLNQNANQSTMFVGDSRIMGYLGSKYDFYWHGDEKARIDGGPSNEGYLTDISHKGETHTVTFPDNSVKTYNHNSIVYLDTNETSLGEHTSGEITFKYHNGNIDTTSNQVFEMAGDGFTCDDKHYKDNGEIRVNSDKVIKYAYKPVITNSVFPENPEKDGYIFMGWFTEEEGGEKYTEYTGDEPIVLHAQYGLPISYLMSGSDINNKINYLTDDSSINEFRRGTIEEYNQAKDSFDDNYNIISTDESPLPTYMWYDGENILYYSEAESIYMNADSSNMFSYTYASSIDVTEFDTSNVTNMSYMFSSGEMTELDLSHFNTSNVTNMTGMFQGCSSLQTIYVSNNWSTESLEAGNGEYMFSNDGNLVGSSGTTYDENHTEEEYARPDEGVSNPGYFTLVTFYNVTYPNSSTRSYKDGTVINLGENDSAAIIETAGTITFKYHDDKTEDTTLTKITTKTPNGFIVNGNHIDDNEDVTINEDKVIEYDYDETVVDNIFPVASKEGYEFIGWYTEETGGEKIEEYNGNEPITLHARYMTEFSKLKAGEEIQSKIFWSASGSFRKATLEEYNSVKDTLTDNDIISIEGTKPTYLWQTGENVLYYSEAETIYMNEDASSIFDSKSLSSIDLSGIDFSMTTNMNSIFRASDTATITLGNINTSNVTNMGSMFGQMSRLTSIDNLSFDTHNVTDMSYMFYDSHLLTELDLSDFDTSSVENMEYMFAGCNSLTSLNISSFETSQVTTMYSMFKYDSALTEINVSDFVTSNVESFSSMFEGCTSLSSIDVTNFDTQNANSLDGMFKDCSLLTTLDLSSFDTQNVMSISEMFSGDTSLETIYVSDAWSTNIIADWGRYDVFSYDENLVGGAGTVFDEEHTNYEYARIDGGVDNPGYLTLKVDQVLPTDFDFDADDIKMVVGQVHQIGVTFTPEGSGDTLTYSNYDDTKISVVDGLITGLSEGTTTITVGTENTDIEKTISITVLSDKLESTNYTVTDKVRPKENEEDPDITDRIIIGAEPGTLISDFKSNLDNPSEYIKIYDGDTELSEDDIVKTGLTIKLEINGIVHDEAIIIIRGDINEDGLVNVIDKSIISEHVLRLNNIEGYKIYAADVDNNDSINITDKSKLSEYILRLIDTLNE